MTGTFLHDPPGPAVAQHENLGARTRVAPTMDHVLVAIAIGVEHRQCVPVGDRAMHPARGIVDLPELAATDAVDPHDAVAVEMQEFEGPVAVRVDRIDATQDVEPGVTVEVDVADGPQIEPGGLRRRGGAPTGRAIVDAAQAVAVHLHPRQFPRLAPRRREAGLAVSRRRGDDGQPGQHERQCRR